MIMETTPTQSPQLLPPASSPSTAPAGAANFAPQLAQAAPETPTTYTVRAGENLSRIVRDQLRAAGRPSSAHDIYQGVQALAQANSLANPDLIHPGQELNVSVLRQASASPPVPPPATASASSPPAAAAAVTPITPRPGLPLHAPSPPESRSFRESRAAALADQLPLAALAPSAGGEALKGAVMGSKRVDLAPSLQSKAQLLMPSSIAGVPPPPVIPSITAARQPAEGLGGPQASALHSVKMAAVNTLRGESIRSWVEGVFDGPRPKPVNPWQSTLDAKARITSEFGMRQDPFTGRPAFHAGVDLATPSGTPIRAYKPGVVTFSGWQSGYGKIVIVRHEDGHESVYAHNSKNLVQKGEVVTGDSILAEVGATGRATGPHLHFEIRKNGKPVNPIPYLQPGDEHRAHTH